MKYVIVFIDYENVPELHIENDGEIEYRLYIFIGQNQKSVPTEILMKISTYSKHPTFIQICGTSKNNLDFHLCAELGILHAQEPLSTEFIILSKDTGFDPLISYFMTKKGRQVTRKESLSAHGVSKMSVPKATISINKENIPSSGGTIERMAQSYSEHLLAVTPAKRPRKVQTLKNDIRNFLKKENVTTTEVEQVYQTLMNKETFTSDTNSNTVSYHSHSPKKPKKTQPKSTVKKAIQAHSTKPETIQQTREQKAHQEESENKRRILVPNSGMGL
jgi:hypothetical protein